MQNFALKNFPAEIVEYRFFNRSKRKFLPNFVQKLKNSISDMQYLSLSSDERAFLKLNCPFDDEYLDYLSTYRFDPSEVFIDQKGYNIEITIRGLWHKIILWEVPLMYTISELYFSGCEPNREVLKCINQKKAKKLFDNGVFFSDMGSRRRLSFENHKQVIEDFIPYAKNNLIGTSNLYLAKLFGIKPIGTKAHELYSLMGSIYGFIHANTIALETWDKLYKGKLSIALPDTFTSNAFLHSFKYDIAKSYSGVRQDSGIPLEFADKFIKHYEKLGIDHKTKILLFSDSLNDDRAIEINKYLEKKYKRQREINPCGIGTFFSFDIPYTTPLNMVIKLTGRKYENCWIPVVKISDDKGKNTGNREMIDLCLKTFEKFGHI